MSQKDNRKSSLFYTLKLVIKYITFLTVIIASIKTVYILVNDLKQVREYMKTFEDGELTEEQTKDTKMVACAQHILYIAILWLATIGIFSEKYSLIFFSLIICALNATNLWEFKSYLFCSIDLSVILTTTVLAIIYYKDQKYSANN